jgi:hypothetical protein
MGPKISKYKKLRDQKREREREREREKEKGRKYLKKTKKPWKSKLLQHPYPAQQIVAQ